MKDYQKPVAEEVTFATEAIATTDMRSAQNSGNKDNDDE